MENVFALIMGAVLILVVLTGFIALEGGFSRAKKGILRRLPPAGAKEAENAEEKTAQILQKGLTFPAASVYNRYSQNAAALQPPERGRTHASYVSAEKAAP